MQGSIFYKKNGIIAHLFDGYLSPNSYLYLKWITIALLHKINVEKVNIAIDPTDANDKNIKPNHVINSKK